MMKIIMPPKPMVIPIGTWEIVNQDRGHKILLGSYATGILYVRYEHRGLILQRYILHNPMFIAGG